MEITTRMEFDAGHRIPGHKSTCKNLHGHRYALEVTIKGEIVELEKAPEFGMVLDFKDAKELIKSTIIDRWDHAFIVYEKDHEVVNFLKTLKDHKTVTFPKVPTAENMALVAYESLKDVFKEKYGRSIVPVKVRLYETPNNWADIS